MKSKDNTEQEDTCFVVSQSPLKQSLQEPIKSIIAKAKYSRPKVVISNFNTFGDNFLGTLYEIDIKNDTGEDPLETNLFVKEIVQMDNYNFVDIKKAYMREEFVYNELSQVFTRLQDQANVPNKERYKFAKSFIETNSSVIILENLTKKGFKTYNKDDIMPIKYAELAIQEMAKFHALSFVIEKQMPDFFNNKIKVLNNLMCFDKDWNGLIENVCAYIADLCDDETKNKIQTFVPTFLTKFPQFINDQTTIICSLTHGDFKKNNVLVRFLDGDPVDVVPVDYQLIDYGCPLKDFMLFVLSGSDREFRKLHLNDLKELYFATLSNFLKLFDLDVEDIYPRSHFDKTYLEWMNFGLMITLFSFVFTCLPESNLDLENLNSSEMQFCPDKKYNSKMRGIIDDFVQWGYL